MSDEKISLQVDLADPDDARAKVGAAEAILDEKRNVAADAVRSVAEWEQKLKGLKILAGMVLNFDGSSSSPVQDQVVAVLEREGRLMRPIEVAEALRNEGHQVTSNDAVNAALHAAAGAGRIRRPKERHYAPLKARKGS